MDAFNHSSNFQFNPKPDTMVDDNEDESEFLGILDVYIHHARNIHNICIYNKQDVYAKFSLTCSPDEMLSTRIIHGGGKNPGFNENLMIKVTQPDSILKCEIWVLSRARNYMEDQLLGFTLVPISQISGKGKVTEDYSLSSTDLFHSPAGTVKLSLEFNALAMINNPVSSNNNKNNSSITSEVVLLDRKVSAQDAMLAGAACSRIEFPDVNVVTENQIMVSEYSRIANPAKFVTFLQLRSSDDQIPSMDDYEMSADCDCGSSENNTASPNEICSRNSSFQSSPAARLSCDERNSAESKNTRQIGLKSKQRSAAAANAKTPPPKKTTVEIEGEEQSAAMQKQIVDIYMRSTQQFTENTRQIGLESKQRSVAAANAKTPPPKKITVEIEGEEKSAAMQKQIVDIYMRSMQQFTESLANMKLPMEIDSPAAVRGGAVGGEEEGGDTATRKKKDHQARVFYGSRAFF